jgi:lipopolysaccharide transport system ATP-binding protein
MSLLSVSNLGKSYPVYASEWLRVARWFGLRIKPRSEHWVLRGVNFSIQAGESIGLIGQNGAGKSTLLKLLTGTLFASEGEISIQGRVAAILELGMGFSSELTGRQNVYHAAGLMGFNEHEIRALMPKIESFAEVGNYFDEPMRMYSSGMQVRVAFALATVVRPDLLIVDEALSVGDAYFQHKCFERIRAYQEKGTSLLLVSHDRNAIQGLCERALLLNSGTIVQDGTPEEIFDYYNALIAKKGKSSIQVNILDNGKRQVVSGTGEARIQSIGLYNQHGERVDSVGVGDAVELRICVKILQQIDRLILGYGIKDRLGQVIYGTNTWHTAQIIKRPMIGQEYEFVLAFQANLGVGTYSVQLSLSDTDTHMSLNYEWRDMALFFDVININQFHFAGTSWLQPKINIEEKTLCSLPS